MKTLLLCCFGLIWGSGFLLGRTVTYDLTIAQGEVNLAGKPAAAMTLNGGIPGPILRFTEGDIAVIRVHNAMSVPTSIHWHGLLLPNDMDGVPFVTYPPILAGTTFTYRFAIRQHGTYWYHSHTMLQEQRGVYGSIVISPKGARREADLDHVVVLSDWTDRNPHEILRNLHRGTEYYGIEKGTAQSLLGAAKTGKLGAYFSREAMRMPAMDLADLSYDAFLINGRLEESLSAAPGRTVRLRVINGSSSSFFHLSFAGGPFTIISADGQNVRPFKLAGPLLIGVAETYDVLVRVPARGAHEFRATAHDGSGYSSLWIGSGAKHPAGDLPKPFVYDTMMEFNARNAFALSPAGTMGMPDREVKQGDFDSPGMHMGNPGGAHDRMETTREGEDHSKMNHPAMKSGMEMSGGDSTRMAGMPDAGVKHNLPVWYDFLLRDDAARAPRLATDGMMSATRPFAPYAKLRSVKETSYPASAPRREFRLTLDGDMERYVWMINNQPIQPENDIRIHQGEVVRFIMINRTMMHHPMHLHGHFFRVLNGQGDYSPLKHTVDVEPMSTTVIEFMADEPGDWLFHCHLLYHMMSGMARVVEYQGFSPAPETVAVRHMIYRENNPWLFYGSADILSSQTEGTLVFSDPLHILALTWEAGWREVDGIEWESDLTYTRYLNRFSRLFAGGVAEGNNSTREHERLVAGFHYLLPGNFHSRVWIDSDGGARTQLEREFMLTPRLSLFGEGEYDTRDKWSSKAGVSYILNEYLSATALWDSDYGWGAGFTLNF